MTAFTATLTLVAVALGLFLATLANRLAGSRGWASVQSLSLVALTAAAYAVLDLASSLPMPDAWAVAGQQLELTAAGLHVLAWFHYSRRTLDDPRPGRWVEWTLGAATLATLVPGAVRTGTLHAREVPALGLSYREAEATPVGELFMAIVFGAMALLALRYWRAWRRGAPGAGAVLVGCAVLWVTGTNDALANAAMLRTPLLLGIGFFVPIVAATWSLAGRFVREMAELAALRGELERQVAERARGLAEVDASLRRDARLAALGRFTGAVAHAINNPAAVAAANVDHLARRLAGGGAGGAREEAGEPLHDAREALLQIGHVTRQLLLASRFAAESWSEGVEVLAAVRDAVDLARERGALPAQVTLEVPPGLRTRAHRRGLAEVIASLFAHARGAAARAPVELTLRARRTGGALEVVAESAGWAVPEGWPAGALEPFPAAPGAGTVSLGVCRLLVQAQGGDLGVRRAPGGGGTVWLTLPDGDAEAAA